MKSINKYGLWTGLIIGVWGILSFTIVVWMNEAFFHNSIAAANIRGISGLFSIFILVVGIYWGIREEKRKVGNVLPYGKAIKAGLFISLITAIIVSITTFLYCTTINPGYSDFMVRDVKQTLTAAGKSTDEINQGMASARKAFSTGAQVGMALIGQLFTGTIASLIIGFFLSTKKKIIAENIY